MTSFELLSLIGEIDDHFVLSAQQKPQRQRKWPIAMAAVLVIAILGGSGTLLAHQLSPLRDSGIATYPGRSAASSAAAEAPAEAFPETEAAEAPAAEMDTMEEALATDESMCGNLTPLAAAQYPESIAWDDYEANSQVWQENQVTDYTSNAVNTFSYQTASCVLKDSTDSGCFSPLSLYQTLSMLASGSEGETRQQLLTLLGQPDVDTLREESGKLYRINYKDNDITQLKIANSLWLDETAQDGSPVNYHESWVLSTAANYYTDVFQAEFEEEETAQALGSWIAGHTGGFLSPSPAELNFDASTVMSIVNTVWYRTQWNTPFSPEKNTQEDFNLEHGNTVSAEFMHREEFTGHYVDGDGYLMSSLGFETGHMTFVLPDEGVDVDELLSEDRLKEIFEQDSYEAGEVHWSIPKFETTVTYELSDMLKSLGVTTAFDLSNADFTPIAESTQPLFVGKVQQGTHISIYEDGLEAAAYTAASMADGSEAPPEDPPIIEMNLNRPFIYLITAQDGSPLFIGVVRNPAK